MQAHAAAAHLLRTKYDKSRVAKRNKLETYA
jgi:hypothetical protein